METKCKFCGTVIEITKHKDKIPVSMQTRYNGKKFDVWYSTNHECAKLKGLNGASFQIAKMLSKIK